MRLIHFFCWLFVFSLVIFCQKAVGQQDSSASIKQAFIEVGGLVTSGNAVPFWQRANQYGTVPLAGSFGTVHAGFSADYRPQHTRQVDWGYGLEVVGNAGSLNQQVILPQAYIKARWRQLEVYIGRRRNIVGLVDTLLTSGSYAMSGNALPLPTIQFGTRGYAPLPFTKGFVSINATFGNAKFESANRKVINTYLNQSTFYVRLGKPTAAFRVYGGFNHQVVWGGYSQYLGADVSNNGYLPSNFKAYIYAITGLAYPTADVDGNVASIDELNRIGNHLGSLDLGAEFDIGNCSFLVYRQNPYDTGALFYLTTIEDGLNGISIRRKTKGTGFISVDRGLFEFLYTANQGGDVFVLGVSHLQGRVNYFNSSQFIDGWTTHAHTIGTPFLTPEGDIRPSIPYGPIANNRVSLLHVGLSGMVGEKISWQAKLSYSHNFGTYISPLPGSPKQFSGLLKVAAPIQIPLLGETYLNATLATDQGSLLPNGTGFYVGLRKNLFSSIPIQSSKPQKKVVSPLFR